MMDKVQRLETEPLRCTYQVTMRKVQSIPVYKAQVFEDFDGDQLYLLFIKEQALVPELMKLHPICTLLGGQGEGLDNAVKITSEQSIGMHRYLTEDDTIDIKKYQDLCEKNLKVS